MTFASMKTSVIGGLQSMRSRVMSSRHWKLLRWCTRALPVPYDVVMARYWSRLLVVLVLCRLVILVLLAANPFKPLHVREGQTVFAIPQSGVLDVEFILAPLLIFFTAKDYHPLFSCLGFVVSYVCLWNSERAFPAISTEKYSYTGMRILMTIFSATIMCIVLLIMLHHALNWIASKKPVVRVYQQRVYAKLQAAADFLHDRVCFGLKGYHYPIRIWVAFWLSILLVLIVQIVLLVLVELILYKQYLNPVRDAFCCPDCDLLARLNDAKDLATTFTWRDGADLIPSPQDLLDAARAKQDLDAQRKESLCFHLIHDILTPMHAAFYTGAIFSVVMCIVTNLFMMRQAKILFLKLMTGYWVTEVYPELALLAVASQQETEQAKGRAVITAAREGRECSPKDYEPLPGSVERLFSKEAAAAQEDIAQSVATMCEKDELPPSYEGRNRMSVADGLKLRNTLLPHIASNSKLLHAARVATTDGFRLWSSRTVPRIALVDPRLHPCAARAHFQNSGSFIGSYLFNSLLVMILVWLTLFWQTWLIASPSARSGIFWAFVHAYPIWVGIIVSILSRSAIYWLAQSAPLVIQRYKLWNLVDLAFLFVGLAIGIASMLMRLILAVCVTVVSACRVDRSLLPTPYEHMDPTYAAFISVVLTESTVHEHDAVYDKARQHQTKWKAAWAEFKNPSLHSTALPGAPQHDGDEDDAEFNKKMEEQIAAEELASYRENPAMSIVDGGVRPAESAASSSSSSGALNSHGSVAVELGPLNVANDGVSSSEEEVQLASPSHAESDSTEQ